MQRSVIDRHCYILALHQAGRLLQPTVYLSLGMVFFFLIVFSCASLYCIGSKHVKHIVFLSIKMQMKMSNFVTEFSITLTYNYRPCGGLEH